MYNNTLRPVVTFARRAGYICEPVTMQGGVTAARISCPDEMGDPVTAAADFCRRSRGRYVCESRGHNTAAYVYASADYARLQWLSAAIRAAADLFSAARRPDRYDVPAYRAAAAALGLDPDACAAVGVDAVPAM